MALQRNFPAMVRRTAGYVKIFRDRRAKQSRRRGSGWDIPICCGLRQGLAAAFSGKWLAYASGASCRSNIALKYISVVSRESLGTWSIKLIQHFITSRRVTRPTSLPASSTGSRR